MRRRSSSGCLTASGGKRSSGSAPRTRNVLRHADAIALLGSAVDEYPEDAALQVFLSLALWSGGREREAMQALARVTLENADLHGYGRAARLYFDRLD